MRKVNYSEGLSCSIDKMTEGLNRNSLHQTCRLCLEFISEASTLHPIYENVNLTGRYFDGFNESIPDIIASCVGIETDPNDGLPTAICSSCKKSIISSHTFRLTCHKTNRWLAQFKVKVEDHNEIEDNDTASHFLAEHETESLAELFLVNSVKEEIFDESTDYDSESASSLVNANQRQTTPNQSSRNMAVDQTRNNSISNFQSSHLDKTSASKMCVVCGLIVKRLHEHTNLKRIEQTHHIDIPITAADSQNSSPTITEDSVDFLMCRMFHKNIRRYVKVEFLSKNGVQFTDFLRAASETFNFRMASFDHFVDQDGYIIQSHDFINVIASDAGRNGFAVGVILRKGGKRTQRPPVGSNNQMICTPPTQATIPTVADQHETSPDADFRVFNMPLLDLLSASPVTASDLQAYLVKRKASYLFQEYNENSMLSDKSRRFLINAAADFLQENFGTYPKRMHKEALAHAIIELFPTYKTQNSSIGGIDLFLNGQNGYLNIRLKSLQNKRRTEKETSVGSSGKRLRVSTYDDSSEENETESDVNVEKDFRIHSTVLSTK